MKKDFLESRFMGRFRPLFVSWFITDKCNMHCLKCGRGRGGLGHAEAPVIDRVIEEAAANKVWRINLTGGELLLHPALGDIIERLNHAGVRVSVSSNGLLVTEKLDALAGAAGISLSLDGGSETHDAARGPGSFESVLSGLAALREYGIPAKITSVISRHTGENDIEDVVKTAAEYGAPVSFQPLLVVQLGTSDPNTDAPDPQVFRALINHVIELKEKFPRAILNSVKGLRHLMRWPDDAPITCGAGRFFCQIDPAGNLFACGSSQGTEAPCGNILQTGLMAPFEQKKKSCTECSQCWCGERVEANLMFGLDPHALINYFRTRHGYD